MRDHPWRKICLGLWWICLTLSGWAQGVGFDIQAVGKSTGTVGLARLELSLQNPTRRPRPLTIVVGTPFAPLSGAGATVFLAEPVDLTIPAGATQKLSVAVIANSDDPVAGAYEPTLARQLTGRFHLIHEEAASGPSKWPSLVAALRPATPANSAEVERLRGRLLELEKVGSGKPIQTASVVRPPDPPPATRPPPPPAPPPTPDRITGGSILLPGASLESPGRRYRLAFQTDGNCVVYRIQGDTSQAIWATQTHGEGCRLLLEPSGKLRVVDSSGQTLWQCGEDGPAGECLLQMQDDGNLVLYRRTGDRWTPLWSSQG